MWTVIMLVVVFLLTLIVYQLSLIRRPKSNNNAASTKNLRGPYALPIVGNYLQFPYKFYEYAYELSKKYGPIFRLRFGSSDVVVLSKFEQIRDVCSNAAVASRPDWLSMTLQSEFQASFAFRVHGPQWRFLRKNAVKGMTILKNHASKGIQSRCERALRRLVDELVGDSDGDGEGGGWSRTHVNPSGALFRCVCTIMGKTCFGRQFDPDDPQLWHILNSAQDTSRLTKIGSVTDCFPWARVCFRALVRQIRRNARVFNDYAVGKLDLSYETADAQNETVYDLTDALRMLIAKERNAGSRLTEEQEKLIRYSAVDLFGAGLYTTLTTLEWALLVLAVHADVKDKMHSDIVTECGDKDFISPDDRPLLPYVEATITEILRFGSTLPFGLPHCTTETVQIDGFTLPEGTPVLCNLWAVHHDPETFPNPYKFDPERFLIQSLGDGGGGGNVLNSVLAAKIIPFSTGIRRCPGENLARQHLFLILANLVKMLDFTLTSDYPDFNQCECNFSRKPLEYTLKFRLRCS